MSIVWGGEAYSFKLEPVSTQVFWFCLTGGSSLEPWDLVPWFPSSPNVTQWLKSWGLESFKSFEVCVGLIGTCGVTDWQSEKSASMSNRLVLVRKSLSRNCCWWWFRRGGACRPAISSEAVGLKNLDPPSPGLEMAASAAKLDSLGESGRVPESCTTGQYSDGLLLLLELNVNPLRNRLSLLWSTSRWKSGGADFFLLGGTLGA